MSKMLTNKDYIAKRNEILAQLASYCFATFNQEGFDDPIVQKNSEEAIDQLVLEVVGHIRKGCDDDCKLCSQIVMQRSIVLGDDK